MKKKPRPTITTDSQHQKRVGATLRTMQVLEHFAGNPHPMSAAELTRATDQNPSTAFNILRTLVSEGYLQHLAGSKLYMRGPALYRLARKFADAPHIPQAAAPLLQELASKYDVSVSLWRRDSVHHMMLLMLAEGSGAIRLHMTMGIKVPLLQGSMGRIMALEAGLPDEERHRLFSALPLARPISYRTFLGQARLAREQGWSQDDGNWHEAVASLSAPVRIADAPVEYLCTVAMFRQQHAGTARLALASDLLNLASRVAPLINPAY
ncbi:IclR family transcriptional regulator [Vineibacter terrae]|uniref:IclR family transcriptional regulator n=1 Tax=Vineibacter terrae TaxID=2586908 RepID=UPI002E31B392|nr:helix-turn-helix domain-containing protein [Vineibacter terrae]HEX2886405.1 helix-turn-helix domain-containing protein [Vineibacter terrae]